MTNGVYQYDATSGWNLIYGRGQTPVEPPVEVKDWKVTQIALVGAGSQPDPVTSTRTLWGTSAGRRSGETWSQAAARIDAALGPNKVWRYFCPGNPPQSWPPEPYLANKNVIISFKLDPIQVPTGVYDTILRNFFRAIPADRHVWWTNHHECDVKVNNGQYTVAQWIASHRHIHTLSKLYVGPKTYSTLILTGYQATSRLPQFYPGDAYVDALGWDPYHRTSTETAPTRFSEHVNLTAARGKQLLICETGDNTTTGDHPAKTAYINSIGQYLEGKATAFTYFNSNPDVGVDWEIDNKPNAADAFNNLTAKTYVGPLT